MTVAALAAVMLALPGRAEDKDEGEAYEFKTVLKAFDGGPKEAGEKALATKEDWKEFIKSCAGEEVRAALEKVEVDFEKEVLIAVALGERVDHLSKGEKEEEGISKVTMKGDAWTIHYTVVSSDCLEGSSWPVFVIRVPKLTQTFTFKRKDVFYGG